MKKSFKQKFLCVDGPFKGQKLRLHPDGNTLVFRVRNHCGRYVYSALNGAAVVQWEPRQ